LHETLPEAVFGEDAERVLREEEEQPDKLDSSDSEPGVPAPDSDEEGILPEGTEGLSLKPKSFLFDRETIEKYARKAPLDRTGKTKGLTFSAPELKHRGYMRMLKEKIESIWKYPEKAVRKGIYGDLYITFSILKDGTLGEARLIRTSGYKELDEAAMKALREAAPYWPLPEDWEGDELTITGHFVYFIWGAQHVL